MKTSPWTAPHVTCKNEILSISNVKFECNNFNIRTEQMDLKEKRNDNRKYHFLTGHLFKGILLTDNHMQFFNYSRHTCRFRTVFGNFNC